MAVFVRAADAGSFAAAAPGLGMSAPMAGKHVRFLEEWVGAQLLNRTTRRQSLTHVGQLFYERCKLVLAEAEAAEALAHDLQSAPRGRLRVSAPVTFGSYSLAPSLTRYMRRYPDISVDLNLSDRVVDMIDEGYDAAIRISALRDSTLIARALRPYRLVACAAPAYLAERGVPAVPEDLRQHECLGFSYQSRPPLYSWEFIGPTGEHRVEVGGRFLANAGPPLRAAALEGFGITLQAEEMLCDDLVAGRLVRVLPEYTTPPLPMYIVFPSSHRPTPKLRSFIDFVVEAFG